MEGTIAIQEERSVVEKLKNWYQKKMIDSGRAAKLEEGTDILMNLGNDIEKTITILGGLVAGVVLFPENPLLAVAVGAFIVKLGPKFVDLKWKLTEKAVIKGKRATEAIVFGADGSSEKVTIPDLDLTKDAQDVANDTLKELPELMGGVPGTSGEVPPIDIPTMKM